MFPFGSPPARNSWNRHRTIGELVKSQPSFSVFPLQTVWPVKGNPVQRHGHELFLLHTPFTASVIRRLVCQHLFGDENFATAVLRDHFHPAGVIRVPLFSSFLVVWIGGARTSEVVEPGLVTFQRVTSGAQGRADRCFKAGSRSLYESGHGREHRGDRAGTRIAGVRGGSWGTMYVFTVWSGRGHPTHKTPNPGPANAP